MVRDCWRVEEWLGTVPEVALTDDLLREFRSDGFDGLADLLRSIRPRCLMVSGIDVPFVGVTNDEVGADRTIVKVGAVADLLKAGVQPDLIWLTGHVNWHQVRRDLGVVAKLVDAGELAWPAIVVVGAPLDPVPERVEPSVRESLRARGALIRDGPYLAARSVLGDRGDVQLCWWSPGRGLLVVLPTVMAQEHQAALQAIAEQAGRAAAIERQGVDDAIERAALVDLLQLYGHSAAGVLASQRLKVGDRIVSSVRRLRRRSNSFRARDDLLEAGVRLEALGSLAPAVPAPDVVAPPVTGPRVTYVLPEVRIAGGVLGVAQLASELRLLGADAAIVALRRRSEVDDWRFLVDPTLFDTAEDLIEGAAPCDVAVATHFSTAPWVHEMVRRGTAQTAAYFLQDYEPWFFAEDLGQERRAVRDTYALIDPKIVKSHWLANLLAADGYATEKIPLGFDLRYFYPRPVSCRDHPVVIAMGRPRTPRRGFESVVAALAEVKVAEPSVEIVLFGQDLSGVDLPFPYTAAGVVGDQNRLAKLYSAATVHLDGSDFQAFGRPALESMACGTPSVLTDVGGVGEYARDEENCLLVPPRQPHASAQGILRLLGDDALQRRVRLGGFDTVLGYSMKQEARRTLRFFVALIENRVGSASPA
jgi:Glycosyl transferases group 1